MRNLYQRYLAWEARWYAPIRDPAVDAGLPEWYLRYTRDMSPVERRQWLDFYARWYGWRAAALFLLPLPLGMLLGALAHTLFTPSWGMASSIYLGVAIIWGLSGMLLGAWFGYRYESRQTVRRGRGWLGRLSMGRSLAAGLACGALLASAFAVYERGLEPWLLHFRERAPLLLAALGIGFLLLWLPHYVISRYRQREHDELLRQAQADAERERLARQLSEARLRLLEAQIEPHFLFNTLGAVQQLAEQGAPRAANLTAHLIQFLRGSLAQMRAETVTLGEDFQLIEAYLQVMQVRLAARLQFSLQLPADLAQQRVPAMMLLTLVENAIKHGIEPALRGGSVQVSVATSAGQLCIDVADSGQGLGESLGASGVGLQNIRERLRLAFGEAAELHLFNNDSGGATARLQLPAAA